MPIVRGNPSRVLQNIRQARPFMAWRPKQRETAALSAPLAFIWRSVIITPRSKSLLQDLYFSPTQNSSAKGPRQRPHMFKSL